MQTIQSRAVADAPRDAAQDRQVGMGWGWLGMGIPEASSWLWPQTNVRMIFCHNKWHNYDYLWLRAAIAKCDRCSQSI